MRRAGTVEQSTIQSGYFSVSLKHDMFARKCVHEANKICEFDVELNRSSSSISVATAGLLHGGLDAVDIGSINMASGDLYKNPNIFAASHGNQFGSRAAKKADENNLVDAFECRHVSGGTEDHPENEGHEFVSNPTMALFRGKEDDEPRAPKII